MFASIRSSFVLLTCLLAVTNVLAAVQPEVLGPYYDVLGLKPGASLSECKSSFKKLSLRHHPDKNVNNPEYDRNIFIRCQYAFKQLEYYFENDTNQLRIPKANFIHSTECDQDTVPLHQHIQSSFSFSHGMRAANKFQFGANELHVHVAIPFSYIVDRVTFSVPYDRYLSLDKTVKERMEVSIEAENLLQPYLQPSFNDKGDFGEPGSFHNEMHTPYGDVFLHFRVMDSHPIFKWKTEVPLEEKEMSLNMELRQVHNDRRSPLLLKGDWIDLSLHPVVVSPLGRTFVRVRGKGLCYRNVANKEHCGDLFVPLTERRP